MRDSLGAAVPEARSLERSDGPHLVGPQEAQPVGLDEAGALGLVLPRGLGVIAGALGADDIVGFDDLSDEAFGVGDGLLIACDRRRGRKRRDQIGVAAFEIPVPARL